MYIEQSGGGGEGVRADAIVHKELLVCFLTAVCLPAPVCVQRRPRKKSAHPDVNLQSCATKLQFGLRARGVKKPTSIANG